jgi:hypothetical protein
LREVFDGCVHIRSRQDDVVHAGEKRRSLHSRGRHSSYGALEGANVLLRARSRAAPTNARING